MRGRAEKALQEAQQKQAKWYNKKVRHRSQFQDGDMVWVLHPARALGVGKLYHKWRGPYQIQGFSEFDNVNLVEGRTKKQVMVHISRLQPFYVEERILHEWTKAIAESFDDEEVKDLEVQVETEYPERRRRNKSGRYVSEIQVNGRWLELEEVLKSQQNPEERDMQDEALLQ